MKIETIEEPTKKASEVLFEHEGEKKNENWFLKLLSIEQSVHSS